jgi:hypothetical protein
MQIDESDKQLWNAQTSVRENLELASNATIHGDAK